MVFFSCGVCGEAVKKNQVERHITTVCRRSRNQVQMSCIDCSKDFWGDEYKTHISCISEEEKYSGKGFKSKQGANKDLWMSQVQRAVEKASGNHKLKNLLNQLLELPNVPRKRAKFMNFVANNMSIRNQPLVCEAWDLIESEKQKPPGKENNESASTNKEEQNRERTVENVTNEKSLSKRERKELRRQQQGKQEKKDKKCDQNEESGEEEVPKKKKKTKHKEPDSVNGEESIRKKRKRKRGDEDSLANNNEHPHKKTRECSEDEETETQEEVVQEKFKWDAVIIGALLKADAKTLSIKKLRKKVMSEYAARENGAGKSEEKLMVKFNKKISKNPRFKVLKDKVTLLH